MCTAVFWQFQAIVSEKHEEIANFHLLAKRLKSKQFSQDYALIKNIVELGII